MEKKNRAKISILEVIQPIDGGSALHVRQLISGLDSNRFKICVAASPKSDYAEIAQQFSFDFKKVDFTRSLNPIKNLKSLWQLFRIIRTEEFDVIHLHSTTAGLLGRLAALGSNAKILYTPHSPLYFQFTGMKRLIFLWVERFTMPLVDLVVLVSESEKNKVIHDGMVSKLKSVLVVNGVSLPNIVNKPPSHPVITMVSRLERQKRQQDLILASILVLKRYPNAEFRLIGEGSRRDELQLIIDKLGVGENVRLLGSRSDVLEQFAQSTMAIQCTETEGLPYVLLEAMSVGLPVVGTRVEGVVDLVREGKTGLLYEKDDHRKLAEQIMYLLDNPAKSQKYGLNGRKLVLQHYSITSMVNKIGKLYESSITSN